MHAARPSISRRAGASVVVTWHTLIRDRFLCRRGTRTYRGLVRGRTTGCTRRRPAMTATAMAHAVLPDGPRSPRLVQAVQFAVSRGAAMRRLRRRYGSAFTVQSLNLG